MAGDVVDFPGLENHNPKARDAVAHALVEMLRRDQKTALDDQPGLYAADFFLSVLWVTGFKVVPLDGSESP